ncbi:helicase/secretion neighborhood CpaE-like protein [Lentzea fradiae]|uniref:Helicase/secretion neighborhood CpaE-like protein n=1 Tax=Lentzea fradiae TaxID=200378 RepID=A0A1G8ARP5_9PSEU|nr:septum site-determining protein Ssd [Lentzea fradiae]SDH23597.1 helicase/secretion neighborhood CpaE-like protein [Lentzea fradiae]
MTNPLALLTDQDLLDEVLRVAAAADCPLTCAPDVTALRAQWHAAPLVLLDPAAVSACLDAGLPRRTGVLVVHGGDPPWAPAVALGVDGVLELPVEGRTLVGALSDLGEGPPSDRGRVVSFVGGRGGAGASILATATGREAVAQGGEAMLVDCDPLGGGIDLALGTESDEGARWPGVHCSGGKVPMSALRAALPTSGSLSVLACDRTGPDPEPAAVAAVLDAGRRAGNTVICDLPRHPTPAASAALDRTDLTILVVPAEVRATAAATKVASRLLTQGRTIRLVVRGPSPGNLQPADMADVIGVPLLTQMRPEPGLAEVLERGRFPRNAKGPLATAARQVLKELRP